MRVAFTLADPAAHWTGGHSYLRNCFQVLRRFQCERVTPVLFAGPSVPSDDLEPFAAALDEPILKPSWLDDRRRKSRLRQALFTGIDSEALESFRAAKIDVVFEASEFFGWRFPMPVLTWIADFQSHHLPEYFPWQTRWRTYLGRRMQLVGHRHILLSSQSARHDYEKFYPGGKGRSTVVPFALEPEAIALPPGDLVERYHLSERFVFLPNQFWRHKNHALVVDALPEVLATIPDFVVLSCGSPSDHRNPGHFQALQSRIDEQGLTDRFRLLGMIPRADLIGLMQRAVALLNPSFFEGWSTTVEEAKALGVPLVLSSLDVHREQAGDTAIYFDPDCVSSITRALIDAWSLPTPDAQRRELALEGAVGRASKYAERMTAAVVAARNSWGARYGDS